MDRWCWGEDAYSEAVGQTVILVWYDKTVEMLKWTVVRQPQFRKRIVVSCGVTVTSNSLSCGVTVISNSLSCGVTVIITSLSCGVIVISNSLSCGVTVLSNYLEPAGTGLKKILFTYENI